MLRYIGVAIAVHLIAAGPAVAQQAPADAPRLTQPVLLKEVKPEYTPAALEAKIEGTVTLEVGINADGTVGAVRVKKSLDREHGLDEQAVAAVRQWLFAPARRDGTPVAVVVDISAEFKLEDGKARTKPPEK